MIDLATLRLDQLPPQQAPLALGLLVALGLLYCFAGYAVLRLVLGLTGFVIAGFTAAVLVGWLSHGNVLAMSGAVLFGGACGAMALSFLYRLGVFMVGLLFGLLLGFSLFFEADASVGPIMTLVAAVAGGIVAVLLERPVMRLATAAIGGWLTVVAGFFLLVHLGAVDKGLVQRLSPHATWIMLGAWAFMTLFGGAFQFSRANPEIKKLAKKKK